MQQNMTSGKVSGGTGRAWCQGNTAKCWVSFFWIDAADYSVVSTDYDTYAIVRNCDTFLWFFRWELYWIVARDFEMTAANANNAKAILRQRAPHYDQAANHRYTLQGIGNGWTYLD